MNDSNPNAPKSPGEAGRWFRLPVFEGPLDLLLHLIKKNELDPQEVTASIVTEQYLEYLELLDSLNLDVAGEYLVMAATLLLIKSFALLPYQGSADEEEAEELKRELIDRLASFVAQEGARGVVVFDGVGEDLERGPLQVRFAPHADTVLERLAAEHRDLEQVCLVSSDAAVRGTSGREVRKLSSQTFLRDLGSTAHEERARLHLADRLDEETRARLERLRRGQKD